MDWFVIRTKPHQERLAKFHLAQLPVETFLPLLKRHKAVRRKERTVIEPLFPGYLFARFDIVDRYRAVNFCRGVSNIVEFGSKPAPVSETLIGAIKSELEDGYITPKTERFHEGQVLQITGGPLSGLEAVFVREMKAQHRVILLLRALGMHAKVTLDADQVCVAQDR